MNNLTDKGKSAFPESGEVREVFESVESGQLLALALVQLHASNKYPGCAGDLVALDLDVLDSDDGPPAQQPCLAFYSQSGVAVGDVAYLVGVLSCGPDGVALLVAEDERRKPFLKVIESQNL